MEKKMENDMEAGIIRSYLGHHLSYSLNSLQGVI